MLAQQKRNYQDKWKLRPESSLIIILEDLDFSWYPEEISIVKKMWNTGCHIADIAEKIERDQDEVAVLIMHLSRKRKIHKRAKGVFGV
jgi:predicted regulator of amino acid metabolism with ACT domain